MKFGQIEYPNPSDHEDFESAPQSIQVKRRRIAGATTTSSTEESIVTHRPDGWPTSDLLHKCLEHVQRQHNATRELNKLQAKWLFLKDSRDTLETTINLHLRSLSLSRDLVKFHPHNTAHDLWKRVEPLEKGPFQNPETGTYLGTTAGRLFSLLKHSLASSSTEDPVGEGREPLDDNIEVAFREDAAELTLRQDPTVRWIIYYSDLCWPGVNVRMYHQEERANGRSHLIGRSYMLADRLIEDTVEIIRKSSGSGDQ